MKIEKENIFLIQSSKQALKFSIGFTRGTKTTNHVIYAIIPRSAYEE